MNLPGINGVDHVEYLRMNTRTPQGNEYFEVQRGHPPGQGMLTLSVAHCD